VRKDSNLQQLVDDGGLVGGVDVAAVAQAQDGHLQHAMKLPQAVHRVLCWRHDLCFRKATSDPFVYITCRRTMSCRGQSRLGSRQENLVVSSSAGVSPCHWGSVVAPTPLAHAAHTALQRMSHKTCKFDIQMIGVTISVDNHAACCANVEVGAIPEESRRSISCLSNGTPFASRAIHTLYSGRTLIITSQKNSECDSF
jgi:hypothetical protein